MASSGFELVMTSSGVARGLGLATSVLVTAACGSAPETTADPAALPLDVAVVWDIPGSTTDEGRGPYFDGSNAPRLTAGPVLVSWWCSGSGSLAVVPGHVEHPGEVVSEESPLAFQVSCPTGGTSYVGWRQLAVPAVGGENVVDIHPVASPSGVFNYRIIFAQRAP